MLAVHWTPVANTGHILKNGIKKSKNGLYCFPLTGHKSLDRWWPRFFNQCCARPRKKYNGIVFKIKQEDMPAYFGHWSGATTRSVFKKDFELLSRLEMEYRNIMLYKLGKQLAQNANCFPTLEQEDNMRETYLSLANEAILTNRLSLLEKSNEVDFMTFAFEDYQIVLSNSIPAKRIVKVLPSEHDFGKVLRNVRLQSKRYKMRK